MVLRQRQRRRSARPILTGRAIVLGAVSLLLVVLLASPVHRYLASRGEVGAAASKLHDDRAQLARLTKQHQRWADPGYVQREARIKLQFAMPGDTVYVVVDKGQRTTIAKSSGVRAAQARGTGWNTRLWNSVRAADK
ncbi:septum formation initiator family protein [uncultured Jatrophihabitans sp.]|uniref:septum formation initiator family protein n=1 Tax=uncultured Jatrophihabitans sp. TaxID=1610747 RepID=UPI0035C952A9